MAAQRLGWRRLVQAAEGRHLVVMQENQVLCCLHQPQRHKAVAEVEVASGVSQSSSGRVETAVWTRIDRTNFDSWFDSWFPPCRRRTRPRTKSPHQGLAARHRRFSDGALPKRDGVHERCSDPREDTRMTSCVLPARVTYKRLTRPNYPNVQISGRPVPRRSGG